MISVLFSGCSFVYGSGLDGDYQNPGHYSNLLCNNLFGHNYQITNIAVPGNSNARIFLETSTALIQNNYDYAFVGWTSLSRFVFWLGLELYNCKRSFTPFKNVHNFDRMDEHNGNDLSWTAKDLEKIKEKLLLINHDHYWIRDIVNYVNILIKLAESTNTKIYFLNILTPWDDNYFNHIPGDVTPSILTEFTNELLCSKNRDDVEINKLYHMMHNHYEEQGGIREDHWLNLYQSFYSIQIDSAPNNIHPGLRSQKLFADFLTEEFKKHN